MCRLVCAAVPACSAQQWSRVPDGELATERLNGDLFASSGAQSLLRGRTKAWSKKEGNQPSSLTSISPLLILERFASDHRQGPMGPSFSARCLRAALLVFVCLVCSEADEPGAPQNVTGKLAQSARIYAVSAVATCLARADYVTAALYQNFP